MGIDPRYVGMLMQANAIQMPLKDNCIDCVVTDPPYGLEFMGKKWDNLWGKNQLGAKPSGTPSPTYKHKTSQNYRCKKCGHWKLSGTPCRCDEPEWERPPRNWKIPLKMQEWHYRWAVEVLRVMKPGAMMFCFGGTRTHHRAMCAIEDAGFEIRDVMMWLYGSGFPKSHDISKAIDKANGIERKIVGKKIRGDVQKAKARGVGYLADPANRNNLKQFGYGTEEITIPATPEAQAWEGQGTALKPAWEPIILAMKPLDGTFAQNALKWGVAGLSIDAGRILFESTQNPATNPMYRKKAGYKNANAPDINSSSYSLKKDGSGERPAHELGRWPANVILDEEAAEILDGQSGITKSTGGINKAGQFKNQYGDFAGNNPGSSAGGLGDSGGASRFFYCAKASRSERNAGLGAAVPVTNHGATPRKYEDANWKKRNTNYHPTVKPLALIEYLVRLGSRPGHIILDPFIGSGTTIIACDKLNRTGIGLDLSYTYLSEIAKPRQDVPLQRMLM